MMLDAHTHNGKIANAIVNVDISSYEPHSCVCCSVGIHPWACGDKGRENALKRVEWLAENDSSIVAIGETGLDAVCGVDEELQLAMFRKHIELSEKSMKPLIIHCVRRSGKVLELYKEYKPKQAWVMHGFRGNENVLRPLLEKGIYISLGEKFNEQSVAKIPDELVLIETDESALTIDEIAERVAKARNTTAEQLKAIVSANLDKICHFIG